MSINTSKPKGEPLTAETGFYLVMALIGVGLAVVGLSRDWVVPGMFGVFILAGFAFLLGSTWGCDCPSESDEIGETEHERPAGL